MCSVGLVKRQTATDVLRQHLICQPYKKQMFLSDNIPTTNATTTPSTTIAADAVLIIMIMITMMMIYPVHNNENKYTKPYASGK